MKDRILTLDLLRGYFLVVIIIDHLFRFPNPFEFITGRGELWVSAAEGFFIISGLLVGYIYKDNINLKRLWGRASKLYVLTVILTITFSVWGRLLPAEGIKTGIWTGGNFWNMAKNAISLNYVYGWTDFLPYYAVFLLFSPVVLYAIKKWGGKFVVAVSIVLWLVRGSNFYLAWQVLFFGGITVGYYLPKIENELRNKMKMINILTLITVIASIGCVFFWSNLNLALWFDKNTLAPGRLILAWMWFGSLYMWLRPREALINRVSRGYLLIMGRNSLFVYVLHAFVIFPNYFLAPYSTGYWGGTLVTLMALIVVYLAAKNYKSLLENPQYLVQIPRLAVLALLTLVSRS